MLARRIILSLCLNEGQLTRTKWFRPDRWYTLNYVDLELADEIVLLDVTRAPLSPGQREKFWSSVRDFSRDLFLPLSVGGWIRSMEDVRRAFEEGADKIVINTALYADPNFGTAVAHKYGAQALVGSVDVRDGEVYVQQGNEGTGIKAAEYARALVSAGAGEIFLMDIDRDGSLLGYNLPLVHEVSSAVTVPVVAVGGCGNWSQMEDGFNAGADACATQVIHHLTNTSLKACKTYLRDHGVEVRL